MTEQTFHRWLITICIIGVLCTVALVVYTAYVHHNCSIIAFIANEGRGAR